MKEHPVQGKFRDWAMRALKNSSLFGALSEPQDFDLVLTASKLIEAGPGEVVVQEGEIANSAFLILNGEAKVVVGLGYEATEVGAVRNSDVVGEIGILLRQPRNASVVAKTSLYMLQFSASAFETIMDEIRGFARHVSMILARRLAHSSRQIPLPEADQNDLQRIDTELLYMFSEQFIKDNRIIPIKLEGNILILGSVYDPTNQVIDGIRGMLPGMEMRLKRVSQETFDKLLRTNGMTPHEVEAPKPKPPEPSIDVVVGSVVGQGQQAAPYQAPQPSPYVVAPPQQSVQSTYSREIPEFIKKEYPDYVEPSDEERQEQIDKIEPLLRRMLKNGASDLHLSACQKPHWRIDGDIFEIPETRELGKREAYDLLGALMPRTAYKEFENNNDTDFSFSIEGLSRFRVNMFHDENGISGVLRVIPHVVPSAKELRLPPSVMRMSKFHRGLVLVTGPTGSGKSTTLAALINQINETRPKHIITLEDPIEFVHPTKKCLVNQREVGRHAKSFAKALRAALREDPDIVLVGELRDMDTMALALETANTGHLVFGTLHTNNAISTIDRVVDMFPVEEHHQIRSTLSEVLSGVVSQTLCKKKSGGRIAAFEVLISNPAVGSLIRQGKSHQIVNALSTDKHNLLLNKYLAELVRNGLIEGPVALEATTDPDDLRTRLPRTSLFTQKPAMQPQQYKKQGSPTGIPKSKSLGDKNKPG